VRYNMPQSGCDEPQLFTTLFLRQFKCPDRFSWTNLAE
jgi:hypothetical protein